jgi:tRNA-specific 2-thiouridylase
VNKTKKQTVFLGVSGGVDSSVSAAILQEQGYDVVGVFIKTWQPEWVQCTWRDEKRDAMRVCAHLGIPFLFFDFEQEYKEGVADYMIAEYKAGRTPNPDVMCNKEIKFGAFYKKAKAMGADFVATGHYAQKFFPPLPRGGGSYSNRRGATLVAGHDTNKDQTYFLWTIPHNVLQNVLFPIGHLGKKDVRKLAEKYKLPTATKKDSQGICFIGPVDMKDFLSHYIETKEGSVLDEKGAIIGSHDGALLYTLGERHGFTISTQTPDQEPYFIVAKDIKNNTLTVSKNKFTKSENTSQMFDLISCNWISAVPEIGKTYSARFRYREALSEIRILAIKNNTAHIEIINKETILTPGQSAVLYEGETCLGGGIIV